jgi:hypothetical protein
MCEKFSNITFHDNPSSGNRVVLCELTNMTKLMAVFFRNFADASKTATVKVVLLLSDVTHLF